MMMSDSQGANMRRPAIAVAAIAALTSTSVLAADMAVKAPLDPPPTIWSWSGLYVGAGGSVNWTHFDQSLQGVSGVTNVLVGPFLVAQGQAGGPFFDFNRNGFGLAPDIQLGYVVPLADGPWQAGLKFTYKYANIDSKENVSVPQAGSFTTIGGATINFPGFVAISPAEINLKHQLAFIPTIGRAFGKVTIYAGGGPALFDVQTKFINGVGFAVIGGQTLSVTGAPMNASNDNWVWGGAAQVGATYAFAPHWFLDVGYTYARSASFNIQDFFSFSNQNGALTSSGTAFLNAQERVTNQSVVLTLNRQF